MRIVLILGAVKSGTSLLCSLLGAHPDINMLYESLNKEVLKLYGKKYAGNKLLLHRQIRFKQRSSRFGHLVNRIVNLNKRPYKYPWFPMSAMSISDYLERGAKVIYISRNARKNVKSISGRKGLSIYKADKDYSMAISEYRKIKRENIFEVSLFGLTYNTTKTLGKICDYLDLGFSLKMLNGVKHNSVYPYGEILKKH